MNYHSLERFAANHMTKELFLLFILYLEKASFIRVLDCHETSMLSIYSVISFLKSLVGVTLSIIRSIHMLYGDGVT